MSQAFRSSQCQPERALSENSFHSAAHEDNEAEAVDPANGRTGRMGGVVTLIPPGFRFAMDASHVLVPGHAIYTRIVDPNNVQHVVIKTGRPRETWDRLLAALPASIVGSPNTVFVGDFNTDLTVYGEAEGHANNN